MTEAIRHRGPDDEGFAYFDPVAAPVIAAGRDTPANVLSSGHPYAPADASVGQTPAAAMVALGHRRLAIVDLSAAGHQPMCDQSRRYWLVYNGEVYNYIELRHELERLGHTFVSHTDTEVILAAYAQWGEDCLSRFNGMWAFVLVDVQDKTLFAACDRFGVKQLYYWQMPQGGLALASEIKAFTVLPGWQSCANTRRCRDFLYDGIFDHTEETLFAGVRRLRGGQALRLTWSRPQQTCSVRQWYELPQRDELDLTPGEAAAEYLQLLDDAVRLRLRADVRVGSCLSGGLDSSSIVCLVNRQLRACGRQEVQETVSSCYDIQRFDERPFIEAVTAQTGVRTHYVFPRYQDLFADLEKIIWHQDEPFNSTSIFAQWKVFAEAQRQGLKVMLDGQGADELLAGYSVFFTVRFRSLLQRCRLLALAREMDSWRRRQSLGARQVAKGLALTIAGGPLERWRQQARAVYLKPATEGDGHAKESADRVDDAASSIRAMSREQLLYRGLPTLLHYEDRNSMAASIEARVPFLDYRLVEYTLSLPDHHKIQGGQTKVVLRRAMENVLPEAIQKRQDKMGFVTPEELWLRETATESFRKALRESAAATSHLVDERRLIRHFEEVVRGRRRFSWNLWRVICFGKWVERFNVCWN